MAKRGRPIGCDSGGLYDLYEVTGSKEKFVGRMDKTGMKTIGISIKDVRTGVDKCRYGKGKDGTEYRIYHAGVKAHVDQPERACSTMPAHVSMIKTSSSCRFGG